ncbi:carbohydrate ABC transporter permease [Cohnella soli]|uniref:Carbohydrate ABC transporter permease n=1 Tax=Cohnella soli TaxID=425005 RepID=A0ABW0HYW3_9BACL
MSQRNFKVAGYVLFLTPALLFFTVLYMYPALSSFVYAFTDWNGFSPSFHFIGIENFKQLLADRQFVNAVLHTVGMTVAGGITINVAGLLIAIVLDRPVRSMNLLRALYFAPALFSALVVSYVWSFILGPITGPLNRLLHALFGFPLDFPWLMSPSSAFWSVVGVANWLSLGTTMAIYLAGLQSIPQELHEAGKVDGVTFRQQLRYITIPMLAPAMTVTLMLSLIGGLQTFDIVFALTKGGPFGSTETIMTLLIRTLTKGQSAAYATTMGLVLFVLILVLSAIQLRLLRSREVEM